ncbi:hypothetical protein ACGFRB_26250 [Streptomyces sp. NPDC048718]|uniref:hypothetical protein n=1 Tax=Streptomyces sp. NPDC048718 TaxID=3365587 RepID=UPI003719A604
MTTTGGMIVGKKQTRVNKGARTGGHEHRAAAAGQERETAREAARPADEPRPVMDVPAHRKERKFGHN